MRSGRVLLPKKKPLNILLYLLYPTECSKETETKACEQIEVLKVSKIQLLEMSW